MLDCGTHVKKSAFGVEVGVGARRRAEGPYEADFEHCVGVAVIEEAGA